MTDHSSVSHQGFHPASTPDYLPVPKLRDLQFMRLTAVVRRAYDNVDLFRSRLAERGVAPESIRTLEDIRRLPCMAKSDLRAYDIYGLSEIVGPGVGIECECHNGLHILEDHFYPEIIDPNSGEPVPDGVEGELLLTTLSKRAMPMIRYRTRDISAIIPEACPFGRGDRAVLIFRFDKPDAAIDRLQARGINVVDSVEVYNRIRE